MFRSWKIRRMLKKGFYSMNVPEKERVLPESVLPQKKEVPDIHYTIENTKINIKYKKVSAISKIAVTFVLIISLFTVMILNMNQQIFFDESSSSYADNGQDSTSNTNESNTVQSDIIKEFREFYNQFNLKLNMTDEDVAALAKSIKLKDGGSVYDQGINFRCDNYNNKSISYGKNNIFVSYTSTYLKSSIHAIASAILINSNDSTLTFPYGIKYGDSLQEVLNALNITDKYNVAYEKLNRNSYGYFENTYAKILENQDTNESISLTFQPNSNETAETIAVSISYVKNDKDNNNEGININITSGKVHSIYIFNIGSERVNFEVDTSRDLTFYFDNADERYNEETGVHLKITKITINDQRAVLTYKAYAENSTTAVINYMVKENDAVVYNRTLYQSISGEEQEYTVIINDCFEKSVDISIGNIGFTLQHSDCTVLVNNADLPANETPKLQYEEILSAFRNFQESFNFKFDYTDEQFEEKAKSVQFIHNKTLFDYGVYMHYDNYNGKGIVYGKEFNKIGYEKGDRVVDVYLMISEETKNINYPLNIKLGASLKEVLEKLNYIDQYKYNENNSVYEKVDGFEVPKTFIIYSNDKDIYKNEQKESLQLKYHTVNSTVTDKSLEKGNVTIQYAKESYINYNSVKDTVKLIFKEGKLKYIYVGYHVVLDYLIPYDSTKSISFHFENNEFSYSSETGIYAKLKTIEVYRDMVKITFITKTDTDKKCGIQIALLSSVDLVLGSDNTTIDIQAGEHEYSYSYTVKRGDAEYYDYNPLTFSGRLKIGGNKLDFDLHGSTISQDYLEYYFYGI